MVWYVLPNSTGNIIGWLGQMNNAVSGNVFVNGDFYWTFLLMGIFIILLLVFFRNNNDFWASLTASSVIGLVLSTIMFSLGFVFILSPLIFILMTSISFLLAIVMKNNSSFA